MLSLPFLYYLNLLTFGTTVFFLELLRFYFLLVWTVGMKFIRCEIFYCLIYWLQCPILGKQADQLQAPLKTTTLMTPADVPTFPANGNVSTVPASSMLPEALPQHTPSVHCLEWSQADTLACCTELQKTHSDHHLPKEKKKSFIFFISRTTQHKT